MADNDLITLAERCEAAKGPDRQLDNAIRLALNAGCAFGDDPAYTASLDAAMTLVPEGFDEVASGAGTKRCFAQLVYPKRETIFASPFARRPASIYVRAASQPLALCAAALRARAAA